MTDAPVPADAPAHAAPAAKPPRPPRRGLGVRIALWVAGVLVALVALVAVAAVAIDTAPGHRLLVSVADGVKPANGLRVKLGRIDGSIYGRLTLRDVTLSDPQGAFVTTPALTVDWAPGALLHKHVLLNEIASPSIRVLRAPKLKPGPPPKPNQPTLPDLHLTLKRLNIAQLILEPALTGDRRALAIHDSIELQHRRVRIEAVVDAQPIDGHAGGDSLRLKVDAEPSANRLLINAHLRAPQGGVVDRLAKLGAPLSFDLSGRGTWAAWDGRAAATLGAKPLLDADIIARDGVFSARGQAQPALVVKAGPVAALTAPALAFDLSGKLLERQLDGRVRLSSSALDLAAQGRLDLARSAFAGVKVDARLLKPEAASPKLNGRDVRAHLELNGPFARPVVDYDIAARELGFDKTVIENLHVAAKARVDANQTLRLPVHATAARVTGLPEAAGGLTTNLKVDGDVVITKKQIASDNLRIRSDRLDATLVLALSLDTGRYDAALKGRINRYAIAGLGVVDLVTDAKLVPTGRGEFRVAGHVHAQTLRLDNAQAQTFLGGQAVVDADFSRSPDGAFGVANLRLSAPKFRILNGQGSFRPDGRIAFVANAISDAYGPLKVEVGGTAKAPQVRLQAANPKVAGVTGLDVQLKGIGPNGYLVTATGNSQYGPISAQVELHTGKGALTADIRRASVGGINVAGQVRQTPAGPFAGVLRLSGSGLSGTATLGAAGQVQRVDLVLHARDARLPLAPPVTVARGDVTATAILYPGAPAVTGRATLSGVRRDQLVVSSAKASVDLRGGSGQVQVSAAGSSGVPFTLAADAAISPELIRVTGQGSANRIPLRLAGPADIHRTNGGLQLAPVAVVSPQGRLVLAGATGPSGVSGQAQLQAVDLSIVQAFAPTLGIAGKASGTARFTLPKGGAAPTGRAQLQVTNFTRSGLTTVSEPVDIALLADLAPSGAEAHAVVRRRGVVVGRLQARLAPIPPGSAPWTQRIKSAPLTGGVRYDGPAEVLWGLSGVGGQEVSGPLAIGVDVSGRLDHPQTRGVIKADALRYENTTLGTVIDHIAIDGRFDGTRLEIAKLTGRAGKGSVSGAGYADLSSANGFPIDLRIKLADAQLAKSDSVGATVSGDLAVTNSRAKGALVAGKLTVDRASYEIVRQGAADVVELAGVRRKGQPLGAPITPTGAAAPAPSGPPSVWKLDIAVNAANQLFVRGMGLEAEFSTALKVGGDAKHPVVTGDVNLVRGTFSFAGRELTLSRGTIHLDGSTPPNPTLDLEATTTVDGTTAIIDIAGTATHPDITFSSSPALPQDEVLSRLLFGSSVAQISPLQAVQLAAALNGLRGGGGGLNPLGKLRQVAGVDRLRFYGADKTSGRGPSVGAGKYISSNIYVEVTTDARGFTATQIEIALTKTLRLLSQVGSLGGSNLSLRYSRDY